LADSGKDRGLLSGCCSDVVPLRKIVDLFMDMPCEFTEDDFREEIEATERRLKAERERVV
jgi:hypothetical protein